MSATIARQGGRVQLELSDMHQALNMAKIAKEGYSHATIEETKYLIQKPSTEVHEGMNLGVEFPADEKVKAASERHPAMLRQKPTSGCPPCQNGTAKNYLTHSRYKGPDAPPPAQCKQLTEVLISPLPGTPPALTGNYSRAERFQIVNWLARHACSHTGFP
jgi:hypothetical protein